MRREERDVPGRCRQVAVWACGWRPPTPRAGNEPQKNGFLPQKHLLSEPFAVGVSARQVSRKKPAKRRCCSASARSEKGLKSLSEERGEKEKRERKKKNICVLFIYSEPRTLPIILYITRCLGKSCSETIFVTRENPACAFAPLGESIKHFVPYETRHAQID